MSAPINNVIITPEVFFLAQANLKQRDTFPYAAELIQRNPVSSYNLEFYRFVCKNLTVIPPSPHDFSSTLCDFYLLRHEHQFFHSL